MTLTFECECQDEQRAEIRIKSISKVISINRQTVTFTQRTDYSTCTTKVISKKCHI